MDAEAKKPKERKKIQSFDKFDVAGVIAAFIFFVSHKLFFNSNSESTNLSTVIFLSVVVVLVILIFVNAKQRAKLLCEFRREVELANKAYESFKSQPSDIDGIDTNAKSDDIDNQ